MTRRATLAISLSVLSLSLLACTGAVTAPQGGSVATPHSSEATAEGSTGEAASPRSDLGIAREKWAGIVKQFREGLKERAIRERDQLRDEYRQAVRDRIGYSQQQRIKRELDKMVRVVEKGDYPEPRFTPDKLGTGDVAKLGTKPGITSVFIVTQIIDNDNALLDYDDIIFWVELPTRTLSDGDRITLPGLVECTGTRQYKTVLGATKTVRTLRVYGTD